MTSFQVTELKNFMTMLLKTECFDSFLLEEALIAASVEYRIDGKCNRDFYTKEEWDDAAVRPYEFTPFSSIRPICFDMIKGRRSPSRFKFVLHLMPDYVPGVLKGADASLSPEQVKALVLTVRFENGHASLVTGTAFHSFVMDKSLDVQWDRTMRQFLARKGIAFTED